MIEILAHSGDPAILESVLHPSGYLGTSYLGVFLRLLGFYVVPVLLLAVPTAAVLFLRHRKPEIAFSWLLVFFLPGALWLALVYADPSYKGTTNLLELSALGGLVGLVLGINGRLVRPFLNCLSSAWVLCAVAVLFYVYLPGHPTRYPLP